MNTDEQILQDAWYGRESTADSGINEEEQGDDVLKLPKEVEEKLRGSPRDWIRRRWHRLWARAKESGRYTAKEKSNSNFAKILAERNVCVDSSKRRLTHHMIKSQWKTLRAPSERAERNERRETLLSWQSTSKRTPDEPGSSEHNMDIETEVLCASAIDPQTVKQIRGKETMSLMSMTKSCTK